MSNDHEHRSCPELTSFGCLNCIVLFPLLTCVLIFKLITLDFESEGNEELHNLLLSSEFDENEFDENEFVQNLV